MKNHFKFQSLIFYGVAIGSVLVLFKVVTAYGESNLKAPAPISGSYRLSLAQNFPNCPKSSNLVLDILQSGIYLNGSLLPADSNTQPEISDEKTPFLTGQFSNQKLSLAGTVPSSTFCNRSASQPISIQSQVQGKNLEGQITLNSTPQAIAFTAVREAPAESTQTAK